MSSWHWAIRIAGWIALAVIIAIAFHYAKKYEAEMLTDAPPTSSSDLCRGRAHIPTREFGACSPEKRRRPGVIPATP